MSSINGLKDALNRIEEHLDFARLIYRSLPFMYWSSMIPLLYIASSSSPDPVSKLIIGLGVGAGVSLWFILEENTAYKVLVRLNMVLGRNGSSQRSYVILQLLSWVMAGFLAYASLILGLPVNAWPLVFFPTGTILIMIIDKAYTGKADAEMLASIIIPLTALPFTRIVPLPTGDYTVMIISSSLSMTGFLYVRRAFRA